MFKNIKVGENDKCVFYTNNFTKKYKGYDILLTVFKETGKKMYIIVKAGEVLGENQSIESIYCKIDILYFLENKD